MDFFTLSIENLLAADTQRLIDTLSDRDIVIIPDKVDEDHFDVVISHIGTVTMTPLMMWILHHINRKNYYRMEIV
jgi:hypothetical protein